MKERGGRCKDGRRSSYHMPERILVNSVLHAIPTYVIQCFLIPKGICDEIEAMIRRFWWGKGGDARGVCWKDWRSMCKTKEEVWVLENWKLSILYFFLRKRKFLRTQILWLPKF